MPININDEFDEWAGRTAKGMAEKDTPMVYVTVIELKPLRSRREKLKVEMAA